MHIQHRNHAEEGHLFNSMQSLFRNIVYAFKNQYKSISTNYLSQDHVHHNTNTTKCSHVNMHINIIEHIINTTL